LNDGTKQSRLPERRSTSPECTFKACRKLRAGSDQVLELSLRHGVSCFMILIAAFRGGASISLVPRSVTADSIISGLGAGPTRCHAVPTYVGLGISQHFGGQFGNGDHVLKAVLLEVVIYVDTCCASFVSDCSGNELASPLALLRRGHDA